MNYREKQASNMETTLHNSIVPRIKSFDDTPQRIADSIIHNDNEIQTSMIITEAAAGTSSEYKVSPSSSSSTTTATSLTTTKMSGNSEALLEKEEESGRERLKRYRKEVAGRVWIPDIWGQEEFLKNWIDCNSLDAPLIPNRIISARAALVQQATRANSSGRLTRC